MQQVLPFQVNGNEEALYTHQMKASKLVAV